MTENKSFENVPPEIIVRIFKSVARGDLACLARTSCRFFHIAVPLIWGGLFLDAKNLLRLLPEVVTTGENGVGIVNPNIPGILDPDMFFSRFEYYSQFVISIKFDITGSSDQPNETGQINCLDYLLGHTLAHQYFPKLQFLQVTTDASAGENLIGLSWAALFLSKALISLVIFPRLRTDVVTKSSYAIMIRVLQQVAARCPTLDTLTVPSDVLAPNSPNWLSGYRHMRSLDLSGQLTATRHRDIFTAARFAPDTFSNLRRLTVSSDAAEIILDLWTSPIVTYLTQASIRISRLDNEDAMKLFGLIGSFSPRIDSLSVSLSPNAFSRLLLNQLSALSLRKLNLDLAVETLLMESHAAILEYIGLLWPGLEFLIVPFNLNFDDFLQVHKHLPCLRHLLALFPLESIEEYEVTLGQSWESPPTHPLVLWTHIDMKSFTEDPTRIPQLIKLIQLLATAWPYMRLLIKDNPDYFEFFQEHITGHSSSVVQEKNISDTPGFCDRGMIQMRELSAYVLTGERSYTSYN